MIKKIVLLISISLLLSFAGNAWSYSIQGGALDGTDVGLLDTFIDSGDKLGNPTAEELWIETILGDDADWYIKDDPVPYYATEDNNVFAFEIAGIAPEYYLIKNAQFVALYKNLANMAYGVFDASVLPDGIKLPTDDFEISHVSRFNAVTPVPEPATMFLLGIGLLGVAKISRKRNRT